MFKQFSRSITTKRFQHAAASSTKQSTSHSIPFNNKYNFDLTPPPIHEYWNIYNSSVLFAFIPVFLTISYFAKDLGIGLEGNAGLLDFANSENSPIKNIKFGESQVIGKQE
ncbi:uncharacterized protein KGF55_001492 [Candida pseudojiufengensis]|uniref:uncharacterized protein n=1 Tax=Candida pseudojiufengensis TaxID=497109 RepID=UPI002224D5E0|nr:uncharacterized protein KGF55_001492 [Candida pseudojiufengensis]KAI5965272.1 hypothetical protein KGF55_001492 [Candida pseudojiufengensis]